MRLWHHIKDQLRNRGRFGRITLPKLQDALLTIASEIDPQMARKAREGFRARAKWVAEQDGLYIAGKEYKTPHPQQNGDARNAEMRENAERPYNLRKVDQ